jgi:hypothetical protein
MKYPIVKKTVALMRALPRSPEDGLSDHIMFADADLDKTDNVTAVNPLDESSMLCGIVKWEEFLKFQRTGELTFGNGAILGSGVNAANSFAASQETRNEGRIPVIILGKRPDSIQLDVYAQIRY